MASLPPHCSVDNLIWGEGDLEDHQGKCYNTTRPKEKMPLQSGGRSVELC